MKLSHSTSKQKSQEKFNIIVEIKQKRVRRIMIAKHTRNAIFLSLFIVEKCFRCVKTIGSRGLSGAALSLTIQG